MNYSQARQMRGPDGQPTGKWHWTTMNDGHVRPDGYCSPWETCPECHGNSWMFVGGPKAAERRCVRCDSTGVVKRADPCPGHDTPEAAAEHYRQYLLDNVTYDGRMSNQQQKCRVCGAWTSGLAQVPFASRLWVLCDEHRTRESVDRLLEAPGAVWSS